MPGRPCIIANGEYYHVYNRGVAKRSIFLSEKDNAQALLALTYYLYIHPPMKLSRYKELSFRDRNAIFGKLQQKNDVLVQLIAFTFMPNHIHVLLRQIAPNGIATYMSQFQNSYTRYFNTIHMRVGPLFQGAFKAVRIESEEQLLHVTRYIHLNPVVA